MLVTKNTFETKVKKLEQELDYAFKAISLLSARVTALESKEHKPQPILYGLKKDGTPAKKRGRKPVRV